MPYPAITRPGRSALRVLVAACSLLLAAVSAAQTDTQHLKNEVRAAFVYNIARFVSWPQDTVLPPSAHINFCLYRANFLGDAIASIAGKPLHRSTLHVSDIASLSEAAPCHALLIPDSELATYLVEASETGSAQPLTILDLTARDRQHLTQRGIMIALVRKGAKLGFEVNLEALRRHGYNASSELLKLAVIVTEEGL